MQNLFVNIPEMKIRFPESSLTKYDSCHCIIGNLAMKTWILLRMLNIKPCNLDGKPYIKCYK